MRLPPVVYLKSGPGVNQRSVQSQFGSVKENNNEEGKCKMYIIIGIAVRARENSICDRNDMAEFAD